MDIKNDLTKTNRGECSSQETGKKSCRISRNFFRIAPIVFFIITVLLLGLLVGGVVGLHVPLVVGLAGVSALLSLVTGGVFLFKFFMPGKQVPVKKLPEFNPFTAIPEEFALPEFPQKELKDIHDLHEAVWKACGDDRSLEVVRSELALQGTDLIETENWKECPVFTSMWYPGVVFKSFPSKGSVERKCDTYLRTVQELKNKNYSLIRTPKIRVVDEMGTAPLSIRGNRYLIAEECLDGALEVGNLSPDEVEQRNYAAYCQKGDETTPALMQLLELMRALLLYDVSYRNCPILQSTGPKGEVIIGISDPVVQLLPGEPSLYSAETVCIKFIEQFVRNERQLEQLESKILELFPFRSVHEKVVQRYIELKAEKRISG